ncbi:MAG: hypothetical protein ACP5K1_07540 [Candidatus Bathyarchaeia archaeon]
MEGRKWEVSRMDSKLSRESLEDLRHGLERAENFQELFDLVRRIVKRVLGRERAGLMLFLADLPLRIGAFHGLGSNSIVVNRRILEALEKSHRERVEVNSYIFVVLLHEYLHSLGFVDESLTRRMVYGIATEIFGHDHPAAKIAEEGPGRFLDRLDPISFEERPPELVKEFDAAYRSYIH